jgi:hypothetical protein
MDKSTPLALRCRNGQVLLESLRCERSYLGSPLLSEDRHWNTASDGTDVVSPLAPHQAAHGRLLLWHNMI